MNVAIKRLSVAVTIILFSLQSAFAGNGKNPCTGDKQLNSASVMNTPSAQNQPVSDLPRDDALIAAIIINAFLATSDQDVRVAGGGDVGESIHAREWLMLTGTGFSVDYWLIHHSYNHEALMELILMGEELSCIGYAPPVVKPH
jgi:hypothetical protein